MTMSDWIAMGALGVSGLTLLGIWWRGAAIQGGDRTRLEALEKVVPKLATAESVGALGGRLHELEDNVKQVAKGLAAVALVEEKVVSLDRLVTGQLDEIKYTLRRLEERSFEPAPAASRHKPATP